MMNKGKTIKLMSCQTSEVKSNILPVS